MGSIVGIDLGEQSRILKGLQENVSNLGQKQRWSFMTVLYLIVRKLLVGGCTDFKTY